MVRTPKKECLFEVPSPSRKWEDLLLLLLSTKNSLGKHIPAATSVSQASQIVPWTCWKRPRNHGEHKKSKAMPARCSQVPKQAQISRRKKKQIGLHSENQPRRHKQPASSKQPHQHVKLDGSRAFENEPRHQGRLDRNPQDHEAELAHAPRLAGDTQRGPSERKQSTQQTNLILGTRAFQHHAEAASKNLRNKVRGENKIQGQWSTMHQPNYDSHEHWTQKEEKQSGQFCECPSWAEDHRRYTAGGKHTGLSIPVCFETHANRSIQQTSRPKPPYHPRT